MAWMLGKRLGFSTSALKDGYYRFLWLEALAASQSIEPLQGMTPQLGLSDGQIEEHEAYCIDLAIHYGSDQSCWGRLIVPATFRKEWITHFGAKTTDYFPSPLSKNLDLTLGIKTGSMTLYRSEWSALKAGDVVILDRNSYDARQSKGFATIMLGPTPLFQAKIHHHRIELIDFATINEASMPEQKTAPHHPMHLEQANETPIPIKDIPIQVSVELARLKLTLDQLMNLSPGNMIELPIHPEQSVSLTVGGQKVGKAELIHIGETLGIRLIELG
jgi:type III secretion system YscQ/HrcQ family protein